MEATKPSPSASIEASGRRIRVVGPSLRDPRLHVAAVILTVQVLGQAVLDFRVSIAQILVCLAAGALIEVAVALVKDRTLSWPGSGLLTGSSTAFILRTPGTLHGQWWSLNGIWVFLAVVAVSMASKYLIRWRGRHVFNPSNLGLVLAFAALGPRYTEPQDLWWLPPGLWMYVTYAVLLAGGLVIAWELRLVWLEAGFMLAFAASTGLAQVLAPDHCMVASWRATPLCGDALWQVLVVSPEVLVFGLFMVPDPRTVPEPGPARLVFGVAVGVLAALLLGLTSLEFWTKTAILASLVLACAGRFALSALIEAEPAGRRRAGWAVAIGILTLGVYMSPAAADAGARTPLPAAELADGSRPALALAVGAGPEPLTWAQKSAADGLPPPGSLVPHPSPGTGRVWMLPPVPPVTVPANVVAFNPRINADIAATMAHDAVLDLIVESEARRSHDATLAQEGADQDALKDFVGLINQDVAGGRTVQRAYTIDRAELKLFLPKFGSQAPRLVGVSLRGTTTVTTFDATGNVVARTTTDYAQSWGLGGRAADGHQRLVTDYSDLAQA